MVRKRLYFELQPFKSDTCCNFLGPHGPRIYVDMSIFELAVFRTQVVEGRYFFVAIARGLLNYVTKVTAK